MAYEMALGASYTESSGKNFDFIKIFDRGYSAFYLQHYFIANRQSTCIFLILFPMFSLVIILLSPSQLVNNLISC